MESGDFEQVDRVKRRILGLYRGDIGKWPGENTNHVRNMSATYSTASRKN